MRPRRECTCGGAAPGYPAHEGFCDIYRAPEPGPEPVLSDDPAWAAPDPFATDQPAGVSW